MSTDLNTQRDPTQLVFKALLPIFSYVSMPICCLALEQSVLRSCKRFSWEISLKRVSISSLWMERVFILFFSEYYAFKIRHQ